FAGRVLGIGPAAGVVADEADLSLQLRTHGYEGRMGVKLERRPRRLAQRKSLGGQDRMGPVSERVSVACASHFHLWQLCEVEERADMLRLRLGSGVVWSFLWEGADMRVEDSIRQSAHFGFHRTRQIVLDVLAEDADEVSWIFTLEEGCWRSANARQSASERRIGNDRRASSGRYSSGSRGGRSGGADIPISRALP